MSPAALAQTTLDRGRGSGDGGFACPLSRVGAVEFVKRLQHRVLGFQKGPPHGRWGVAKANQERVGDDGAVRGASQGCCTSLALDLDRPGARLQVDRIAAYGDRLALGRLGFSATRSGVVVLETWSGSSQLAVVPQQGHRVDAR